MKLTLELNAALTIIIWPKWKRVAVVAPFQTVVLSLDEFRKAIRMAGGRA